MRPTALEGRFVGRLTGLGQLLLRHPPGEPGEKDVLVGVQALRGGADDHGQRIGRDPAIGRLKVVHRGLIHHLGSQVDAGDHPSGGALHGHAKLRPLHVGLPTVVRVDALEAAAEIQPGRRVADAERRSRLVGGPRHPVEEPGELGIGHRHGDGLGELTLGKGGKCWQEQDAISIWPNTFTQGRTTTRLCGSEGRRSYFGALGA